MSGNRFYHLHSTGLDPCSMTKDEYARARMSWLCSGCATPKPDVRAVDVHIQEKTPGEKPLTFVNGCGVPIASREFLRELGEERIRQNFYLGKVLAENGELLDNWVTFRGRRRVIIRGTQNVAYRQCEVCGRHVYFAMGSRYLKWFKARLKAGDRSVLTPKIVPGDIRAFWSLTTKN